MHFLFVSHQSEQPFLRYGQKECLTLKIFKRKFAKKIISHRISPKSNQAINMTRGIRLFKFCSDWVRGSPIIVQTSKFLLINATAVTLSQGHGKVIQYFSPDPYVLCPKYVSFGTNGFDVRDRSFCGGGRGGRGGNELKTKSFPRTGWLKYDIKTIKPCAYLTGVSVCYCFADNTPSTALKDVLSFVLSRYGFRIAWSL